MMLPPIDSLTTFRTSFALIFAETIRSFVLRKWDAVGNDGNRQFLRHVLAGGVLGKYNKFNNNICPKFDRNGVKLLLPLGYHSNASCYFGINPPPFIVAVYQWVGLQQNRIQAAVLHHQSIS